MNNDSYFNREIKNPFSRTLKMFLILNIKSERTWVFTLLAPFFISAIIIYVYSTYSSLYRMLPPQLLSAFLVSPIIVGCYFGITFCEIRETYLLKRMKFVGIRSLYVVTSLSLVTSLFSIFSTLINIFFTYIISKILSSVDLGNLNNLLYWNWFYFFIVVIMLSVAVFLICLLGCNILKGNALGISFSLLVMIFGLIFSDIIVPSFISSRNNFLNFFGYLILFKYFTWIILLTSSFSFIDYNGGVQQIIQDSSRTETHVFINNLYGAIVVALVLTLVVGFLCIKTFKWKE